MTKKTGEKIVLVESPVKKGYNCHGWFSTFGEIVEIEIERENEPFISMDAIDIEPFKDFPAIWVCSKDIYAFRYSIDADDWNLSESEIKAKHPEWKEDIIEIDCSDLLKVEGTDDGDDGFLVVDATSLKN